MTAPSPVSRFVSEHFAIIIGGGVVALFSLTAVLGPRPPPRPLPVLSPEEHNRLVADVASAVAADSDASGPKASSYPEFIGLPNMTKLSLFANFPSYVEDDASGTKRKHDRSGVLVVEGEVKRAYLLVHVARPLYEWEKVYVTVAEKGGHLHGAQGLHVPPDERSTTQLYDVRSVPHDVYGRLEAPSDWFPALRAGARSGVHSFLSSRQPGLLDISLFYECAEPGSCKVTYTPIA